MSANGSELSFLLELLLEHKLQSATKSAISERLKFVENSLRPQPVYVQPRIMQPLARTEQPSQAPSTLAAMERQANEVVNGFWQETHSGKADRESRQPEPISASIPAIIPVSAIGLTSAAQEAMATRNKLIAEAQAGIAKKGPAVGRGHGTK